MIHLLVALVAGFSAAAVPCRIEVVEQGSGWPVPLVELRTTHNVSFITDNAGVVAIDLPELLGRETWFAVSGDGYEVKADGFGYRGVRLKPELGKTLRVEVARTIVAKRLGRLTGAGLFAESQRTGQDLAWSESGVFGCDSVQTATWRGRLFWLWGDTTLPQYPLGLFDSSGGTTALQPPVKPEPPVRIPFDLFRDKNGRPRGIAKMAGDGPTWVTGMISLPDRSGSRHLVCAYMKIRNHLEEYRWGLAEWDEASANFRSVRLLWEKTAESPRPPSLPVGHPVLWKDEAGKEWVLFAHPFPSLRCPATFEAWRDPATWEPLTQQMILAAASDGAPIKPHAGVHSGGIAWNAWRKRWVTVFMQAGGKPSHLGELWYAEADAPMGPWGPAVKVLSHANHTFYNPCLHPEFTSAGSPVLLFEGTYTKEFSNGAAAVPRYDYNQILYRLDLDDPRLKPAQMKRTSN